MPNKSRGTVRPSFKQDWATHGASQAPGLWRGNVADYAMLLGPTGGILRDNSGREKHGIINGAIWGVGINGPVLRFNGSTHFVDTNNTFQSIFRDSFTIIIWLRPTDGQPGTNEIPFGSQVTDNVVQLILRSTGVVTFGYAASGNFGFSASSNTALFSNGLQDRHILALVADSTIGGIGGKKIYFDGIEVALDATDNGSTSGITFADYTNPNSPYIGARHDRTDPADFHFNGDIAQVSIYNFALNSAKVRQSCLDPYSRYRRELNPAIFGFPPVAVGVIMNQFQNNNVGADLFNGTLM